LGRPAGCIDLDAVEEYRSEVVRGGLDERGGARLGAGEPDLGDRAERLLARAASAVGEVEGDVVSAHVQQAGPFGRLCLTEIAHSGHGYFSIRTPAGQAGRSRVCHGRGGVLPRNNGSVAPRGKTPNKILRWVGWTRT